MLQFVITESGRSRKLWVELRFVWRDPGPARQSGWERSPERTNSRSIIYILGKTGSRLTYTALDLSLFGKSSLIRLSFWYRD